MTFWQGDQRPPPRFYSGNQRFSSDEQDNPRCHQIRKDKQQTWICQLEPAREFSSAEADSYWAHCCKRRQGHGRWPYRNRASQRCYQSPYLQQYSTMACRSPKDVAKTFHYTSWQAKCSSLNVVEVGNGLYIKMKLNYCLQPWLHLFIGMKPTMTCHRTRLLLWSSS